MEPKQYALALCSLKTLGLILSPTPVPVIYPNGATGVAWTGIHLSNKVAPVGSPWSSRNPVVLDYLPEVAAKALRKMWKVP